MTVTTSEAYAEAVAAEIRAWTARRGLNQVRLSEVMGVNEIWVSRRLRGKVSITMRDLVEFAEALEVDVEALLPPLDVIRAEVTADLLDQTSPGATQRYVASLNSFAPLVTAA